MIIGHLLKALAQLLHLVIQIYIIIIIIRAVISWLGNIPPNPLFVLLRRLTDPVFRVVHRFLPLTIIGGIDISPIIILVALYLIDNLITNLMINYANQLLYGG